MLHVTSFSEAAGHSINEDAYFIQPHPLDPNCWLGCLADGQGGQAGGKQAAQLACTATITIASKYLPKKLAASSTWTSILSQVDKSLSDAPDAGYTTLVAFCVVNGCLIGASNGDSALLAIIKDRTFDLTGKQQKNPPVGSAFAEFVPFATHLTDPWRVIVMSDGVWKYVGWNRIFELAKGHQGDELVAQLQHPARLPGSGRFPDDFTVIILESQTEKP